MMFRILIEYILPLLLMIAGIVVPLLVRKALEVVKAKLDQDKQEFAIKLIRSSVKAAYYVVSAASKASPNKFDDAAAEIIRIARDEVERLDIGAWARVDGDKFAGNIVTTMHADPEQPNLIMTRGASAAVNVINSTTKTVGRPKKVIP